MERRFSRSIALLALILSLPAFGKVHVPFRFAPSEGQTHVLERPWRNEICLNGLWDFQAGPECTGEWDSVKIRIPSPWNVNDFANRFDDGIYQPGLLTRPVE
ncbi:MAG: hypothetical protein IJ156_06485 [Bacteroidales bacterium]|nr:hypothetical protein [Bacteroidales bacterium]